MNNNRLKMVSAILLVCLTVLACRAGATPTVAPATSQIVVPADTPTETTGVTNEPLHEIYAGYTGNKALPYIMIHKSGESLVAIQDANSVNISGVVWNSADGKSIVIHSNSNGLPTLAIVGTDIILYSNYTNDTVDLTIIHADGTRMTIPAKLDTDMLNKIMSLTAPSYQLISYSYINSRNSLPTDYFVEKTILYMLSSATCVSGIATGIGIPLVVNACMGSILGTLIRVGTIAHMDIGNLQTAKAIWDISGCYEGDPLACASVLIAASEQHEKTANEKISNTQLFATSTPSPTFTPISTPTQTLTPAPAYPTLYADQNYLCLEGPGRSYPHAHDILMGTSYQIIGRSSNGWYQIAISFANTHHTSCWIGGGIVSGNINTIPVVEVAPPNSICGWIENSTDTGGWIGTLTVSGTGEVIQLAGVDDTAFNAIVANPLPGNFRIYDPVYHSTDNLSSFSKIEPVSSCP